MKNLYKPSLVSSETAPVGKATLSWSETSRSFLQDLLKQQVQETVHYQDATSPTHYVARKRRTPKKPTPVKPLPTWLEGEHLSAFFASLQPKIVSVARWMYWEVRDSVSVSIEDLAQECLIRVWENLALYHEMEGVSEEMFQCICAKKARWAMVEYVGKLRKQHMLSLEEYLTIEGDEMGMQWELGEPLPESVGGFHIDRQDLLEKLEILPRHERLIVLASYQMEDENGMTYTIMEVKRQYRFTDVEISIIVRRAVVTLACLFGCA